MSNELGAMHNKIVPRQFGDLRGWIDALRDEGELQEIEAIRLALARIDEGSYGSCARQEHSCRPAWRLRARTSMT